MKKMVLASLWVALLLVSCGMATPVPPVQTPAGPRPLPTSLPELPTRVPTAPVASPLPFPTPTAHPPPTANAAGLVIVTRQIQRWIDSDSLDFVTMDGTEYTDATLGSGTPVFPYPVGTSGSGLGAKVGNDLLTAVLSYGSDSTQSWVTVRRNGTEIDRIATGPASPVDPLRGLWSYDDHWVLEIARITEKKVGTNGIEVDAQGELVEDGRSLNDQYGYGEAFSFQTLGGRPFYFFQKNGTVDAWYDGQVVPLGYARVSHYGCCSAAKVNPRWFTNRVLFFASRGSSDYFVQISLP